MTSDPPADLLRRTKIFICYSHRDEKFRSRLRTYLFQLEKAGLVEVWDDKRIEAGQHWRLEIRDAIATTKIAILLVSIDFLNSRFITENELPPLLKAAQEKAATILMVFVGPCKKAFENIPELETFQAFNKPESPLSKLTNHQRDELWDRLAGDIRDYLKGATHRS